MAGRERGLAEEAGPAYLYGLFGFMFAGRFGPRVLESKGESAGGKAGRVYDGGMGSLMGLGVVGPLAVRASEDEASGIPVVWRLNE